MAPLADSEINRILIVTAHPDDLDFGAGGTISQWTDKGISISYCIFMESRDSLLLYFMVSSLLTKNTVGNSNTSFIWANILPFKVATSMLIRLIFDVSKFLMVSLFKTFLVNALLE